LFSPSLHQLFAVGGKRLVLVVYAAVFVQGIVKGLGKHLPIDFLGLPHSEHRPLVHQIEKGHFGALDRIVKSKAIFFKVPNVVLQEISFGGIQDVDEAIEYIGAEIVVQVLGLIMATFQNIGDQFQQQFVLVVILKTLIGKAAGGYRHEHGQKGQDKIVFHECGFIWEPVHLSPLDGPHLTSTDLSTILG